MSTPAKNPTLRVAYGPLIWLVHFSVLYGFNAIACARGFPGAVPWVVAAATLALALAAGFLVLKTTKDEFVDWLSAALAALSLLAILWQALPALMVSPCA
jgi:hypothetical protein